MSASFQALVAFYKSYLDQVFGDREGHQPAAD